MNNIHINGTDAPIIMGHSKFSNTYDLWLIKTGRKDKPDLSNLEYAQWGIRLEEPVLDYVLATEFKLSLDDSFRQRELCSDRYGFPMYGFADYWDGTNLIEIKTANAYSEKDWVNGVPDYYYWQVVHYMILTGSQKCTVASLVGGQKLYVHNVIFNQDDADALIAAEHEFYNYCITDTEPPMQAIPELVTVNDMDVDIERLCRDYVHVNQQIKELEKGKEDIAKNIKELLGENRTQIGTFYKASYTRRVRTGFDDKALAESMPETHKQFIKETSYYQLDIKEVKK